VTKSKRAATDEARVDTRGQICVELEGVSYMLRPSREAIAAIELQTGRSLYDLAGEAISGRMQTATLGLIVAELMRAYGKANPEDQLHTTYAAAKPERIAELIHEEGVPFIVPPIVAVLMGALTGGYTASGEVKPPRS
jgi:hypothetical protein